MIFDPSAFLKKVLGKGFFDRSLLNSKLEVKRNALRALTKARQVAGDDLNITIDGVINFYAKKMNELDSFSLATNSEKLLKNRIADIVVQSEVENIKEKFEGGKYRWLPSDAGEPDPEHQLLYGKVFNIGEGDQNNLMPGERYGCRCGIETL